MRRSRSEEYIHARAKMEKEEKKKKKTRAERQGKERAKSRISYCQPPIIFICWDYVSSLYLSI